MTKQGDTQAAASGKRSVTKNILVTVLVAAVLVGGSASATLYLREWLDKGAMHLSAEDTPVNPKGPAQYLSLDPPFVVNFEDQGILRYLQVNVTAMVRDSAIAEAVNTHLPPIRHDLILLLSSQDFTTLSSKEGKEKLRSQALEHIQSILRQEIGKPGVEAVYFTTFIMQ